MRALFIISVAAVAAAGCAHRNQARTGGIGLASNDASKDGTNGEEGGPCAVVSTSITTRARSARAIGPRWRPRPALIGNSSGVFARDG